MLQGDVGDHESILAALKQVDVVISAVGTQQVLDQLNLIKAIKEVGHIQVCLLVLFHVVKCM
jgi:putative NADH-flavin reductase